MNHPDAKPFHLPNFELLEAHEYAGAFPMLDDAGYAELRSSIKAQGLIHPIVLSWDLEIVDGRNRYKACVELGVQPQFVRLDKGVDVAAWAFAANIARRHLTTFQKIDALRVLYPERTRGARARKYSNEMSADTLAKMSKSPTAEARKADAVRFGSPHFIVEELRRAEPCIEVADAYSVRNEPEDVQRRALLQVRRGRFKKLGAAIRDETRRTRHAAVAKKALEMPTATYSVVYADPPANLSADAMCGMDVSFVAPNAVLFYWVEPERHDDAKRVLAAWEFEYRAVVVWDWKWAVPGGEWTMPRHMELWIATRGDVPPPPAGCRPPSVFVAKARARRPKPAAFRAVAERMTPGHDGARIGLFTDDAAEGWAEWGDEIDIALMRTRP